MPSQEYGQGRCQEWVDGVVERFQNPTPGPLSIYGEGAGGWGLRLGTARYQPGQRGILIY